MSEREALVFLNLIEGIGPSRVFRFKKAVGDWTKIFHLDWKDISGALNVSEETGKKIIELREKRAWETEFRDSEDHGVKIITWVDSEYPDCLRGLKYPPPVLYVKGNLPKGSGVAVVGTRHPTAYGYRMAYKLAFSIASAGVPVVSGLAAGIDTMAHKAALEAGGVTWAVLGCGLKRVYPVSNRELAEEIVQEGCLISEFPLSTPPLSGNFPRRNRIIVGFSKAVVVVEAGARSGAIITARLAFEAGKPVYAVPGAVGSPQSAGTNELIKMGAKVVTSINDIEELGEIPLRNSLKLSSEVKLSEEEKKVLEVLDFEPRHLDYIAMNSGLSAWAAASILFKLERKGLVVQLPGKFFKRAT